MTTGGEPADVRRSVTPERKLVVATTNPGKLREILDVLDTVPIGLIPLTALADIPEPEETGRTFADNARLKALYYAQATGLPSVADDSGIEIAALDHAPGVHSARWHGTDYAVKFHRIYELLRDRGLNTSPARFVCQVALATPRRVLFESEGIINGEIAPEPRGTNGFGYDPIFFYPPFGCTLAELDLPRKASVSHRGEAFAKLRDHLLEHPELLRPVPTFLLPRSVQYLRTDP
jgi:XTP/dITP diphosphohydrolase